MREPLQKTFEGKKVVVTGNTGFKGSWLCLWLSSMGAEVFGVSLPAPTSPNMYGICGLDKIVQQSTVDIRNAHAVQTAIAKVDPHVIFHLAAQPIVRLSYAKPLETLDANIMGTAHVLEAVRHLDKACAVVVVSSDKCYDNREWPWGYRENDPLGGKDPYSMSKGATELVVNAWRESYFRKESKVMLASARAGNVIGGGDWAADRLVPDCVRAFAVGQEVEIRNPASTRPWQHVLEPLGGYLLLASRLLARDASRFCDGWNFGPANTDVVPVREIVDLASREWGSQSKWREVVSERLAEAKALSLNCDKAVQLLGWKPTWNIKTALSETMSWYAAWQRSDMDMKELSIQQIKRFEADCDW